MNAFSRTELLIGKEAMERLKRSAVAVFGIGGVGSFAAEALARCGIGRIALFDSDKICLTNINRQLIATRKTIGRGKADVMRERILDINPDCAVEIYECFYTAANASEYDLSRYDHIVDAIDTVSSKLTLIEEAGKVNVPVISCMGAGNKLDPTRFEVADIYDTSVCPLAKVMRRELKKRGIRALKVVYSREEAIVPRETEENGCQNSCGCPPRRQAPGSIAFVPSVAGLILAAEVVRDLASPADGRVSCKQAQDGGRQ
jgi:tRNA A37 threonylcarbamoyladenosine dehydratase